MKIPILLLPGNGLTTAIVKELRQIWVRIHSTSPGFHIHSEAKLSSDSKQLNFLETQVIQCILTSQSILTLNILIWLKSINIFQIYRNVIVLIVFTYYTLSMQGFKAIFYDNLWKRSLSMNLKGLPPKTFSWNNLLCLLQGRSKHLLYALLCFQQ